MFKTPKTGHHRRCVQTIETILAYCHAHRVAKTKKNAPNGAIAVAICTIAFPKTAALNQMDHVGLNVDLRTVVMNPLGILWAD